MAHAGAKSVQKEEEGGGADAHGDAEVWEASVSDRHEFYKEAALVSGLLPLRAEKNAAEHAAFSRSCLRSKIR